MLTWTCNSDCHSLIYVIWVLFPPNPGWVSRCRWVEFKIPDLYLSHLLLVNLIFCFYLRTSSNVWSPIDSLPPYSGNQAPLWFSCCFKFFCFREFPVWGTLIPVPVELVCTFLNSFSKNWQLTCLLTSPLWQTDQWPTSSMFPRMIK